MQQAPRYSSTSQRYSSTSKQLLPTPGLDKNASQRYSSTSKCLRTPPTYTHRPPADRSSYFVRSSYLDRSSYFDRNLEQLQVLHIAPDGNTSSNASPPAPADRLGYPDRPAFRIALRGLLTGGLDFTDRSINKSFENLLIPTNLRTPSTAPPTGQVTPTHRFHNLLQGGC